MQTLIFIVNLRVISDGKMVENRFCDFADVNSMN